MGRSMANAFQLKKCTVMHFGKNNSQHKYKMNGVILSKTDAEKDVGVIVSNDCKPSKQCLAAAKKANSTLGRMARSVTYRDKFVWIGLYKTYVRPILEYCVQAWRPWLAKDIKVLEDVQRRAVRQVRGLKGSCYEEKLKELDLFSLEYRRERGDAIQTWKILHKHDDVDESVWFERFSSEFDRNTRLSCGNMSLKHKLSQHEPRANSFSVRAPKIWNNLPDNVRSVEKLTSFKDAFDLYHKTRH